MAKILQFPTRCGMCFKFYPCLQAKGMNLETAKPEDIEAFKGKDGCAAYYGPSEALADAEEVRGKRDRK